MPLIDCTCMYRTAPFCALLFAKVKSRYVLDSAGVRLRSRCRLTSIFAHRASPAKAAGVRREKNIDISDFGSFLVFWNVGRGARPVARPC